LEAAVDLSAPYAGLTNVSVFGNQLSGGVLGLEFQIGKSRGGLILEDAYQRGQDLVAVYAQSVERPYRATVYWRALDIAQRAAAAVDLIVSIQTELLDASPLLRSRSRVPADESLGRSRSGDWESHALGGAEHQASGAADYRLVVLPLRHVDATYCEMIHPSDWRGMELNCNEDAIELGWTLVGHFMEKGVVRRLRVRGVFLHGRPDERLIRELYADFAASPPPLTT
jgi:hypothetical protein